MPKLSLLIPIHTEPDQLIKNLLVSINNQCGVNWNDIEIIISSDTDASYGQRLFLTNSDLFSNLKWRTIESEIKNSSSMNRQALLNAATGDYIYYLDADDELFNRLFLKDIIDLVTANSNADVFNFSVCSQLCDGSIKKLSTADSLMYIFSYVYKRQWLIDNNLTWPDFITNSISEDITFIWKTRLTPKVALEANICGYLHVLRKDSVTGNANTYEFVTKKLKSVPKLIYTTYQRYLGLASQPEFKQSMSSAISSQTYSWLSEIFIDFYQFREQFSDLQEQALEKFFYTMLKLMLPTDLDKLSQLDLNIVLANFEHAVYDLSTSGYKSIDVMYKNNISQFIREKIYNLFLSSASTFTEDEILNF